MIGRLSKYPVKGVGGQSGYRELECEHFIMDLLAVEKVLSEEIAKEKNFTKTRIRKECEKNGFDIAREHHPFNNIINRLAECKCNLGPNEKKCERGECNSAYLRLKEITRRVEREGKGKVPIGGVEHLVWLTYKGYEYGKACGITRVRSAESRGYRSGDTRSMLEVISGDKNYMSPPSHCLEYNKMRNIGRGAWETPKTNGKVLRIDKPVVTSEEITTVITSLSGTDKDIDKKKKNH